MGQQRGFLPFVKYAVKSRNKFLLGRAMLVDSCINYQSDHTGNYTYFAGEDVSEIAELPEGFVSHRIPAQHYAKFMTEPGPLPGVVIQAWMSIWNMTDDELGGKRTYETDFELYDIRAQDPANAVVDIYIGLSPTNSY
ncbi:MAG: GyrI-like domain-containing protein [Myxococcota bacterium]